MNKLTEEEKASINNTIADFMLNQDEARDNDLSEKIYKVIESLFERRLKEMQEDLEAAKECGYMMKRGEGLLDMKESNYYRVQFDELKQKYSDK